MNRYLNQGSFSSNLLAINLCRINKHLGGEYLQKKKEAFLARMKFIYKIVFKLNSNFQTKISMLQINESF